jgi:Fe2+ or Zn2+ uptake regulation protein
MVTHPILEQLKIAGFRVTKARESIIEILAKQEAPISAAELLAGLKTRRLHVNKTTVYREIDFLKRQGHLHEIQLGDDKKRFELNTGDHHHHLRCVQCHRVEDIPSVNDLDRIESCITRTTHFQVISHSLEFFGLCVNCQK